NPRGASAEAAESPASPPPMTRTEGVSGLVHVKWVPVIPSPSRWPRRQQHQRLAPPRHPDAGREHVVVAPLDLVEERLVEPAHHPEDRAAVRGEQPVESVGL